MRKALIAHWLNLKVKGIDQILQELQEQIAELKKEKAEIKEKIASYKKEALD